MLFEWLSQIYKKSIYRKIVFNNESLSKLLPSFQNNCVITSSSAWKSFIQHYPEYQNAARLITNPSIQEDAISDECDHIDDKVIVGIGGGRVMDVTKAITYRKKLHCILIPTVLSTTAWVNPTASLKVGKIVKHAKGRYHQIIIDSRLISSAPPSLTFGGLLDILVGYNGIVDWGLKKQKNGGYYPPNGEVIIKRFCEKVITFLTSNPKISPETIPIIVDYFIEGIGNCYGLLSGYPLESSEHFLYYAIEEHVDFGLNHGSVIALCLLTCTLLQEDRALISPERWIKLFDSLKINYKLTDLGISWDLFKQIVMNMGEYVQKKKFPYSLWNLQNFQNDHFSKKIDSLQNIFC